MTHALPDSIMIKLSEFIADKTALYFPKERWDDLIRKTSSTAKEFYFTDEEKFINWLISTPLSMDQLETLASNLTISETFFWREPKVFVALEEKILYELIHSGAKDEKRIRIWSAGCATGEEPYSIAIALRRVIPDYKDWNITILATDINPRILRKAKEGIYNNWSFRNTPPWLKTGYFTQRSEGKYEINPEIKKMVHFAYLNLAEDIYPSPMNNTNAMDIVFCRNVLMYFEKKRVCRIVQNFYRSLIEGGYFLVSSSELSHELYPQFKTVNYAGAIVYKKNGSPVKEEEIYHFEELMPQVPVIPHFGFNITTEEIDDSILTFGKELTITEKKEFPIEDTYKEASNLFNSGCYTEAITKIESENTARAFELNIRSLANLGKLNEAFSLCEKAITENKLEPRLYYLCAMILQEKDKIAEAISFLNRALYLESNFALAYYTKGYLLMRDGNKQQAYKCFENVILILNKYRDGEILQDFEGLTAGRVREIINATLQIGIKS